MKIQLINYLETRDWILNLHYAKRMPNIQYAYALYEDDDEMIGIITYGQPASPQLCRGICGEGNKSNVIELNRLVLKYNRKNEASYLIANSLKLLPKPKIVVSYADSKQDHLGIVYQASNFLFTGTTIARTDMAGKDGKHSRHHLGDTTNRINRSSKHRYVMFIGSKTQKKQFLKCLNYKIQEYPKNNIKSDI